MHNRVASSLLITALAVLCPAGALGQQQPELVGTWEGRVHQAASELKVRITITASGDGTLEGTALIPDQGAESQPLINFDTRNQYFSFGVGGFTGNPLFDGAVSVDGNQLTGRFSQHGVSSTFDLARKSSSEAQPGNMAVLEGTWDGTLDAGSLKLRMLLKVGQRDEGGVAMTMESPGQAVRDLPVTLTFQGDELRLNLTSLGAFFLGILDGNIISGTWRQGDARLPLTFEKSNSPR